MVVLCLKLEMAVCGARDRTLDRWRKRMNPGVGQSRREGIGSGGLALTLCCSVSFLSTGIDFRFLLFGYLLSFSVPSVLMGCSFDLILILILDVRVLTFCRGE